FGTVAGGWLMARAARVASRRLAEEGARTDLPREFLDAKRASARFYGEAILPRAQAEHAAVLGSADATLAIEEAWL
ncbi:MAG: acyl-CoA dehydrogenase, partial [Alphaproteobacteria bacterium]